MLGGKIQWKILNSFCSTEFLLSTDIFLIRRAVKSVTLRPKEIHAAIQTDANEILVVEIETGQSVI